MTSTNKNRLKPNLRFKDFDEDWNLQKIGDFIEERIEYPEEDLPLYSLTIEDGITPKSERYERSFLVTADSNSYKVVRNNDFAYNPMNLRFGAIARHKGSLRVLVSKYYNIFSVNQRGNASFFEHYLKRQPMINFYNRMATGSLLEKQRVHYLDFIKFVKPFPSKQEQNKIAYFFDCIDENIKKLIEQKKLIKTYKKGFLQNIFRTKSFLDISRSSHLKWSEKPLSEVFTRVSRKNQDNSVTQVLTNSAVRGIINQEDFFDKEIANHNNLANYYVVDVDDFVYNPRISVSAPVGPLSRNKFTKGVMSPLYIILKPKRGNLDFLELYFQTSNWFRYMHKIANYGARHDRMSFSLDEFMKMPLVFPPEDEQAKIVKFIRYLDDLLENKQKQIDLATKWKKGLLQQMFV